MQNFGDSFVILSGLLHFMLGFVSWAYSGTFSGSFQSERSLDGKSLSSHRHLFSSQNLSRSCS